MVVLPPLFTTVLWGNVTTYMLVRMQFGRVDTLSVKKLRANKYGAGKVQTRAAFDCTFSADPCICAVF